MSRRLEGPELAAYDHVALEILAAVVVHEVPWLPDRARGLTLGRHLLLLDDDDRTGGSKLVAHELVHVEQYARHGVIAFLWRYVTSYAGNRRRLEDHRQAYLAIPAETEARGRAANWAKRRAKPRLTATQELRPMTDS